MSRSISNSSVDSSLSKRKKNLGYINTNDMINGDFKSITFPSRVTPVLP